MVRRVVIGVVAASMLLIWKSDFLHSLTTGNQPPPPVDVGPTLTEAAKTMAGLKTMNLKFDGTEVVKGGASYQLTGTGTLTYPHDEELHMQLIFPPATASSDGPTVIPINEKIKNGHVYVQVNGGAWKDVTSTARGDIPAGMDPIDNLGFAEAIRSADDLGDMVLGDVYVHHFTLRVDDSKYLDLLKAANAPIDPVDEALLHNADIQSEVWIGASDHYIHQMAVHITTSLDRWDVTYVYTNFVKGGQTTA